MRYSIFFTKDDEKEIMSNLTELDKKHNLNLDWPKIKTMSGDSLFTTNYLLNKKYKGN